MVLEIKIQAFIGLYTSPDHKMFTMFVLWEMVILFYINDVHQFILINSNDQILIQADHFQEARNMVRTSITSVETHGFFISRISLNYSSK